MDSALLIPLCGRMKIMMNRFEKERFNHGYTLGIHWVYMGRSRWWKVVLKANAVPDEVEQVGEGRLAKTSLRLRAEGGGHEGGEEPVPRHDEGAVLPQVPRAGQVQKQLCRPEFIAILPIHM